MAAIIEKPADTKRQIFVEEIIKRLKRDHGIGNPINLGRYLLFPLPKDPKEYLTVGEVLYGLSKKGIKAYILDELTYAIMRVAYGEDT